MNEILNTLGVIVLAAGIIGLGIGVAFIRINIATKKWFDDCSKALNTILNDKKWMEEIKNSSIDEQLFKTAFYVFAIFAEHERVISEESKDMSKTDANFYAVGVSKKCACLVKNGITDEATISKMTESIDEIFKPWRENNTSNRQLFYRLLVKAYASSVNCSPTDPIILSVLNVITLGRIQLISSDTDGVP